MRAILTCCLAILMALLVVGAVSHGVLRHVVQTLPLWIPVVLAGKRSSAAKWAALPCFLFWLFIMIVIWLYLLGWVRLISGSFSFVEIFMTIIVGASAMLGIVQALRMKGNVPARGAVLVFLSVSLLQLAVFRLSLISSIAHR